MTKIVLSMYTSKTFYILRDCKACTVRSLGEIVKLAERALLEKLWSLRIAPSGRDCEVWGAHPLKDIVELSRSSGRYCKACGARSRGKIVKLAELSLWERLWSLRSLLYGRDCKAWGACSKGEIVKLEERALRERLWSLRSALSGKDCEACRALPLGEIVKLAELALRERL